MRNSLSENQTVNLALATNEQHTRRFTIQNKLGEGASCVVYRAVDVGSQLPVVLKECLPMNVVKRAIDGTISWNTSVDEEHAKDRFRKSFEIQREIQSNKETMNTSTHLIDGLYSGNNTLYTVTDIQNAKTYNNVSDSSLQSICKTAKAIAEAVGKYHSYGFLHLDIKPQNIMIFPETREMVKILDFDSVIQKSDVNRSGIIMSYSPTYAAPEQLQGKRRKICEATDIYAIGAMIFNKIFGFTPSADDRSVFSDWDLSENKYFKRLSNKTRRLTKEILHKTLSAIVKGRYKNTNDLITALDELIIESDPKHRYLNNTCHISANFFTGRDAELKDIHKAFKSDNKRAVFLFSNGIGGLGKTELALRYAREHKGKDYDVISFGLFDRTLENLFKSTNFISIGNDSNNEVSLDAIRGLVNERTLLIIDNFDVDDDPMLDDVLSLNCKLLFTSRFSFREDFACDKAYEHIEVGTLSRDEQKEVFVYYCDRKLDINERDVLNDILDDIKGYTLLIPLIAKIFNKRNYTLSEIRRRIFEAGVKGVSGDKVGHRKKGKVSRLSGTCYNILCEVLYMAELSFDEKNVMRNLALLDGVVIKREKFNDWVRGGLIVHHTEDGNAFIDLASDRCMNAINSLVRKSWIQLVGKEPEAKVYLHKVIGEVVRNELKPSLKSCPEMADMIGKKFLGITTAKGSAKRGFYWYPTGLYTSNGIDEYQYNSHILLLRTIFNNSASLTPLDQNELTFSGNYLLSFAWVDIINSTVNPLYGGTEVFKDFLLSYTQNVSDGAILSKELHCDMYDTNVSLMIYELKDYSINALNFAKGAEKHSNVLSEHFDINTEQHVEMYLNICMSVYQYIYVVGEKLDDLIFHEQNSNFLETFKELCKYIKELWSKALSELENFKGDDLDELLLKKEHFEQEFKGFCASVSFDDYENRIAWLAKDEKEAETLFGELQSDDDFNSLVDENEEIFIQQLETLCESSNGVLLSNDDLILIDEIVKTAEEYYSEGLNVLLSSDEDDLLLSFDAYMYQDILYKIYSLALKAAQKSNSPWRIDTYKKKINDITLTNYEFVN